MDLTTLPNSRNEAVNLGSKLYCTGEPCSKGHVAPRYTFNYACVECKRVDSRAYRARNLEMITDRERAYRKANTERLREKDRNYYEANREAFRAYHRQHHAKNREKFCEKSRKYRKENRGKMNALNAKRRASQNQATPKWLTKEQLEQIAAIYEQAAYLTKTSGEPHHVDHIIPLQGKIVCGLHVPHNLQILTADENIRKSNKLLH